MDELSLSDDHVFYTLEGEGIHIGKPSVFMRLAMCNLTCKGFASEDSPHGCDSFVSWSIKNRYTFEKLNYYFEDNGYADELEKGAILKITGGEPMLQQRRLLKWLPTFVEHFGFKPRIDFETNGSIQPKEEWITEWDATFTVSPKMSNNGDPEKLRYKPDILKWHNDHNACFKFVINDSSDHAELLDKYINPGLVNKENIWLMPCCGSRDEHTAKSSMVADICKRYHYNFSPRLQLVIWDKALKV